MFERFSQCARMSVLAARSEAERLSHPVIGTEHLLLAILRAGRGLAVQVLGDAGVDRATLAAALAAQESAGPGQAEAG